jgi:predicted TIM-barrel fold metal-dependent hydrolase
MLTATLEQDGRKWIENIIVIDSHSHLGHDIDEANMMNPLAPGTGTFDFWGNVQGRIKAEWEKSGGQSFKSIINGKSTNISWSFTPYPFTNKLYTALEQLKSRYSDLKEKSKFYSFIDQGVCFPFQDKFRANLPEALYHASNLNVARFTTHFPFSMKLIGYCRVDPMEGEKAVNEIKYAREVLGLRGLKLHPRSEGWVDKVDSEKPIPILIEAAKHSMPIIFDTRGKVTIMQIGRLIKETRNVIQTKYPNLLSHFKVIIAHFAQGNIGDSDVYNTIVQPNTYGDLSMLHGEGAGNFFIDFRKWFKDNNKISVDGRTWSEYLLFATDYPYFGDMHAEKLIIYVINKLFFDNGGTIQDAKNILGLNQLKLLPEYNLSQNNNNLKNLPSTIISNLEFQNNQIPAYDMAIQALAKLIVDNKIDIKRFCIQFKKNWEQFTDDILLNCIKNKTKEDISLFLTNLVDDKSISLLASLQPNTEWNKFGYKFFDPDVRSYFAEFFKQTYLATDTNKTIDCLSQIF